MFKTLVIITVLLEAIGCYGHINPDEFLNAVLEDVDRNQPGHTTTVADYVNGLKTFTTTEDYAKSDGEVMDLSKSILDLSMEEPCTADSLGNMTKIVAIRLKYNDNKFNKVNARPLDKIVFEFADRYQRRNCMGELASGWDSGSQAKVLEDTASLDWLDAVNCPGRSSDESCSEHVLLSSALSRMKGALSTYPGSATAFTPSELAGMLGSEKVDQPNEEKEVVREIKNSLSLFKSHLVDPCQRLLGTDDVGLILKQTIDINLVLKLTEGKIDESVNQDGLYKLAARRIMCQLFNMMEQTEVFGNLVKAYFNDPRKMADQNVDEDADENADLNAN